MYFHLDTLPHYFFKTEFPSVRHSTSEGTGQADPYRQCKIFCSFETLLLNIPSLISPHLFWYTHHPRTALCRHIWFRSHANHQTNNRHHIISVIYSYFFCAGCHAMRWVPGKGAERNSIKKVPLRHVWLALPFHLTTIRLHANLLMRVLITVLSSWIMFY